MKAPASDRDRHRDQKPEPRADAEMHIERGRRVGAQADIERVAERQAGRQSPS